MVAGEARKVDLHRGGERRVRLRRPQRRAGVRRRRRPACSPRTRRPAIERATFAAIRRVAASRGVRVSRPGAARSPARRRRPAGTAPARCPTPTRAARCTRPATWPPGESASRARSWSSPTTMSPLALVRPRHSPSDGRVAEPLAVHAGARLLGDLEPQHRPRPQRARERARAAGRPGPRAFRTQQARGRRLRRPLQRHPGPEHAGYRPLDVRTHRSRRRVDEDHAACAHCRPPLSTRNVFPYVLASRWTASSSCNRPRHRGRSPWVISLPAAPTSRQLVSARRAGGRVVSGARGQRAVKSQQRRQSAIITFIRSANDRSLRRRFNGRGRAGAAAWRQRRRRERRALEAGNGAERTGPERPRAGRGRRAASPPAPPASARRAAAISSPVRATKFHHMTIFSVNGSPPSSSSRLGVSRPQPQLAPARAEVAQRARLQRSDDPVTHRTVTPLSGSTSSSLRSSRRRSPWPAGIGRAGASTAANWSMPSMRGCTDGSPTQQRADRRRRRHPAARRGCLPRLRAPDPVAAACPGRPPEVSCGNAAAKRGGDPQVE